MLVIFAKSFGKDFKKLSPKVKLRFNVRLKRFMNDKFAPELNNHSVDVAYPGCRSLNVTGDYRAIYREKDSDAIFVRIGTHPDLYS